MNQTTLVLVIIVAVAIIVFLFVKNQRDKKEVVDKIKNDYPQRKAGDEDIDVDEKM